MKVFIGFPIRILLSFLIFLLKIALSGLFVMILQVKIQERTLEEMLDQQLKHSSFAQSVRQKLFPVKEKFLEKKEEIPSSLEKLIKGNESTVE